MFQVQELSMIKIAIASPLIDNPSTQAAQGRFNFSIVFSRWLGANDWTHKKISTQLAMHIISDVEPSKSKPISLLHEHQISNCRNAHFGRSLANNPGWRAFRAIYELNKVIYEINSNRFQVGASWDQEFWTNKKAMVLLTDAMPSLGEIFEFYCGLRSDFKLQGEQTVYGPNYSSSEITDRLAKLIRATFGAANLDIIDDWHQFANASRINPSDLGDLLKIVTGQEKEGSIHKILLLLSKIAQGLNAISDAPEKFSYHSLSVTLFS